jgi:hypothetical protein
VRKLRSAAVALLVVLGFTVAVASPAHAAWEGCSYEMVCTYWNGGGGLPVYYYTGPTNGTCIDIGEPWDNDISSVWNRFLNHRILLFPHENCWNSALAAYIDPQDRGNLGYWNDTPSSMLIQHV